MRVCLVSYIHGRGGIQTHTHYLAKGLAERGNTVSVISPSPRNWQAPAMASGTGYALTSYKGLIGAVRAVRQSRPEVVVVCGTGYRAMLGALSAYRAKKVFFEVMSGARRSARDPRRLVHAGFDTVVGQGTAVATRFCEAFGWSGQTAVIPALPDPLEDSMDLPSRDASAGSDRPIKMAYFGRLAAHKNVAFLIEHLDGIGGPGGTLDVWGTGPEREALAIKIIASGLSARISLKGCYPEGADYVALLRSYDLTLLPTVGDEGAPLVLLESMAAGVPFVANGVGGIGDYTNPDCAVTSGDIIEFVPMAQKLVARLRAGEVDTRRLQAHYLERFGFKTLIDRWEALLTALVDRR